MAPFGKLYAYPGNPRSTAVLAIAKANNLEIEVVETDAAYRQTPEFTKLNGIGKVPVFVGSDGYVLSECIAIAIYVTSQNEKTTLLGKTKQDYASILKWLSYFNMEICLVWTGWYLPLLGKAPYNKKNVEDASKTALKAISAVEQHLQHNTYLVGERITLADLFAVGIISRGFEYFFDKKWRAENPNVTRWYETVYNQPIYSAVAPKFELLDTPKLTNVPPKKEQAPKEAKPTKPAPAPKAPKAKEEEEEEEEKPAEPKAKHPLDLLPKATFPLDEWKRYFSNNDGEAAIEWFWKNVNFEEYSLWRSDYKYPEDLKVLFMSNNLIRGLFTRLEASRKFIFGTTSLFGEAPELVMQGVFIVRGQDYLPAFDVAPDYTSYVWTKLDPTKPADKAFVKGHWVDDAPITVNGKEYKYATGQVFK